MVPQCRPGRRRGAGSGGDRLLRRETVPDQTGKRHPDLYLVLEHRVWVLADSGINSRIGQDQWQEIVDHITAGIKQNRQGEAIGEAIGRVGAILQEHFPITTDDPNELHDLIIR